MKTKALIPSPDKYSHPREHFNDINKHSKIYMNNRKIFLDEIIKDSKAKPGLGKYETMEYDEKRCRDPRGICKIQGPKITMAEEMINVGKSQPIIHYEYVAMVSLLV